jgi:uncharacterized protein
MLGWLWVAAMTAGMIGWVRHDARAYARFKTVTDSAERRGFYWRWTIQSFAVLIGASAVSLWLAGAWQSPFRFPVAFAPAHAWLTPPAAASDGSTDTMVGMAIGMTLGLGAVAFVQYRRWRTMTAPVIGDIEPLLPRNRREMLAVLPLSLNAGFSEELFFRLALPLLLHHLTDSLPLALGVSAVAFGLAHAYQGWKGVLATGAVGCLLTAMYLSHGSLLRVMIVHALIDVVALIVRPALSRLLAARRTTPAGALA